MSQSTDLKFFYVSFEDQPVNTAEHLEKIILGFGENPFKLIFGGGSAPGEMGYLINDKEYNCLLIATEDPVGNPALLIEMTGPTMVGGVDNPTNLKIYVRSAGRPCDTFIERLMKTSFATFCDTHGGGSAKRTGQILGSVLAESLDLKYRERGPLPIIRNLETLVFESRLPFTVAWSDATQITINEPTFTINRVDHKGKPAGFEAIGRPVKSLMGATFVMGFVNNFRNLEEGQTQPSNWPAMLRLDFTDESKTTVKISVADTGEAICVTPVSAILLL